MAVGSNKIKRTVNIGSVFESALSVITSSVSFNQGDLLVFDASNHVLKVPAAESEGSTFLGVAQVDVVSGLLRNPFTGIADADTSMAVTDIPGPVYGVVTECVLKTSDTIHPGDLVYLDPATGTNGVTVTGTKQIGVYQGALITTASAGTKINVYLGHRYPLDTLVLP